MRAIPFTLPDVGLREINGKVFLDDDYLILELKDALVGEFDTDFQVVKIEPTALKEVRLDRGLVRDKLCLRPKKDDLLKTVPGHFGIEIPLRIWKTHRKHTEHLVAELTGRKVS